MARETNPKAEKRVLDLNIHDIRERNHGNPGAHLISRELGAAGTWAWPVISNVAVISMPGREKLRIFTRESEPSYLLLDGVEL